MDQNSNTTKNNSIQDLNSKITELELLIEMEKSIKQMLQKAWLEKFTELELLNFDLQRQINLLKNNLREANEFANEKNQIIENFKIFEQQIVIERSCQQRALQDLNNSILQLEKEKQDLEGIVNALNNEFRKQKKIINEKNDKEQELMSQLKQLQEEYDNFKQKAQQQINAIMRFQEGQLNQIKDEVQKQKKEIQELTDEKQKMQEELDKEHRNFLSATDEVVNKNKQITQLNKKIKDLEDSQENQLRAFRQKNNELSEKQLANNDLQYENQQLQNQIDQLHRTENKLREFLNNKNKVSESQLNTELKKFQDKQDNILRQKELELYQQRAKTDQEKEKLRKKMEDEKIAFENKQKRLAQQEGQQNKNRLQRAQNQNVVVRNKDGAMEALCKAGNFYNFENDQTIKCCDTKFKVLKVEIKQDAFDKNILTIEKITVPRDYQVTEEGTWDCIRTEKPFAFGMMKDVFLMKKKQGSNMELYVIKTPIGSKPYTSLNDALTECRSHLICQKLMKKFREQLISKAEDKGIQRKFPPIIYSDFLILQESMNSFWIAERFFNGEFVKYNNNFGFIESDINDLNKMAQAFSFYTYFVSDFNYMVSDVQGVGIYFTDPAINTKDGKFDDTDNGLEGQQIYLIAYEFKKDVLSKDLLEILDMYE